VRIGASAVAGFVATLGAVLLYWWSQFDSNDCVGDECALEWAAVVTLGMVAGTLIGATCGFVVYVLSTRGHNRD
jgi:ribose/xylose/arabinose/galactoside ABC-type transport system permease subunit